MELYLGIDLGGSGIRASIYDQTGQKQFSLEDKRFSLEPDGIDIVRFVSDFVRQALQISSSVVSFGLGSPGPLDYKKGVIESPPNLPKVRNAPVIQTLSELCPEVQGFLVNDADAALFGEYSWGAARGFRNVVGVFAGTGVGSSVMSRGILQRGKGKGAEWGHHTIMGYGSRPIRKCSCGNMNCWEAFVGTSGLGETCCEVFGLKYSVPPQQPAQQLRNLTKRSDKKWDQILHIYSMNLAIGLRNIVCVHHPECIVLGGGIILGNENLYNEVVEKLSFISGPMSSMFEGLVIKTCELEQPGVAGAAAYAIRQYERLRAEGL